MGCVSGVLRAVGARKGTRSWGWTLIQPIRQPHFYFVEHLLLDGCITARMPQCRLRRANIALGELRADEVPEVMRLDMTEADLISVACTVHHTLMVDSGAALARCPRPPKLVKTYSLTTGRRVIHCMSNWYASRLRGASRYSRSFLPRTLSMQPLPFLMICPTVRLASSDTRRPLLANNDTLTYPLAVHAGYALES